MEISEIISRGFVPIEYTNTVPFFNSLSKHLLRSVIVICSVMLIFVLIRLVFSSYKCILWSDLFFIICTLIEEGESTSLCYQLKCTKHPSPETDRKQIQNSVSPVQPFETLQEILF